MKQKTVKSASKRVIKTGSGKLRRRRLSAQHLTSGKSKRTLKSRGKLTIFARGDEGRIRRLINR